MDPKVPMHVAAVIASNYLPHARVLANSLRAHHPDARITLLLVDGPVTDGAIPEAECLAPSDVGIDDRELRRRAMLFDRQGLISSLRPLLLTKLLSDGAEAVLLLDVDMLVLAPCDDLVVLAGDAGIVLSPHALAPLPGRPGAWPEQQLLQVGVFNGGFLGVGRKALPFLAWLAERAARDCLRAPQEGLFYTQTWLDLVPVLFDHHILRDQGINAQFHSLRGQDLERDGERLLVGETPLRLFHFTGFDPASEQQLSRHIPGERGSLEHRPQLRALCIHYANLLHKAGWPALAPGRWETLPSGELIQSDVKATYRAHLLAAERGECHEPPIPFDEEHPLEFVQWLDRARQAGSQNLSS